MSFRLVFVAVLVSAALLISAVILHDARPDQETAEPTADLVRATGKCAQCHRQETAAIVKQYERSEHAETGVKCLDCHKPTDNQEAVDHRGFEITKTPTSDNCRQCHAEQYREFTRSRHGAPAWAAVTGAKDFTEEQIEHAEKYHPGAVDRDANTLARLEGPAAMTSGCKKCHDIGKPNPDGSIGSCTDCHSRHNASLELARQPATCGQCHMGPDHAQLEIYRESKHGVIFEAQRESMNLGADPAELTTEDMPVPTCATCHMSGLEDLNSTHDVGQRLSWYLFAPVSEKRDGYQRAQDRMKAVCMKCHAESGVDQYYKEAEEVVADTNDRVQAAQALMEGLRQQGLLTPQPFDEPLEFTYFDFWHYYGRTAKHGAFMGGADFVQWHGNYELLLKFIKMRDKASSLRKKHNKPTPEDLPDPYGMFDAEDKKEGAEQ